MIFGWRDEAKPQPELAPEAREQLERALELLDQGQASQAVQPLEQAGSLGLQARTAEALAMAAKAYELLAGLHRERHNRGQELEALEHALQAGQEAGTPDACLPAARAGLTLARRHHAAGRADAAREALDVATELAQTAGTARTEVLMAQAALLHGQLAMDDGGLDEAIEALEEAVDRGSATGDLEGLEIAAEAGIVHGRALARRGDIGHAIQSLDQAAALGRSAGTPSGQASATRAWLEQGRIHAGLDEVEQATEAYLAAERSADELDSPQGDALFAQTQLAHGALLEDQGELHAASDRYVQAALRGPESDLPEGRDAGREARSRNLKLDLPPRDDTPGPSEPASAAQTDTPAGPGAGQPIRDAVHTASSPGEPGSQSEQPLSAKATARDPGQRAEPEPTPPSTAAPSPLSGLGADPWALLDQVDTAYELAIRRRDEMCLEQALAAVDDALEERGADARLWIRRARCCALLGGWREDASLLEQSAQAYAHAFERKGGRVDPRTHDPGPDFFFEWGRTLHELASIRQDAATFEQARERLLTGYEMTPRGAHHDVAAALIARCAFHLAQADQDPDGYEAAVERYEGLEARGAGFALEAEDHATWARALDRLADRDDDPALRREAFERMQRAYEREA